MVKEVKTQKHALHCILIIRDETYFGDMGPEKGRKSFCIKYSWSSDAALDFKKYHDIQMRDVVRQQVKNEFVSKIEIEIDKLLDESIN